MFTAATIKFINILDEVEESDVDVVYGLVITRDRASEQTYTLTIASLPSSAPPDIAAEPEDFSVPVASIRFPPDVQNISLPVIIRGDRRIEFAELFDVILAHNEGPPFLVNFLSRGTTVSIRDNDGGEPVDSSFYYVGMYMPR